MSSEARDGSRRLGGVLSLGLLAILFLAAYYPSFDWLVRRWSMGVWYHSHGFLVPPLAGWLAWTTLRDYQGPEARGSGWGFAFLVPAVVMLAVDAVLRFEIVAATSIVLAVPGLCLLLLGKERTQAIWFPLAFLAFAIPIPLLVARKIFVILAQIAAVGTDIGMRLIGFDVLREGTVIRFDANTIIIADPCSGFSTLLALTMFGVLLSYTTLQRWWKFLVLLPLIACIAIFANILRCIALAMLVGVYGNPILDTWVHPATGVVAFLLALPMLVLLVDVLSGSRDEAGEEAPA